MKKMKNTWIPPERRITWENPRLSYLRPISFECLHPDCKEIFFDVGFDEDNLVELKSKFPFHRKRIEELKIKPTLLARCPKCGCMAERVIGRPGPFDSGKLERKKKEGKIPNVKKIYKRR